MNNMIKVKRILIILFFSIIIISPLLGIDFTPKPLRNPFPSEENLNNFTKVKDIEGYDIDTLDSLEISLITISPGNPLYSWFGHSAIMVTQDENTSIIYDYGVFSFNSDNFYTNFIQGKMYYLLITSFAQSRVSIPIEEDRTVSKVVLNLDNKSKLDIVNFLNYNAQSENRTYLYDFYLDNCATRIRDIFNWVTDDDFKEWAKNQTTPYTFRILSSEELDRSFFVNWVLNSFLGQSSDEPISTWETMFLPKYLEKAVIDYGKFNTSSTLVYDSDTSSKFSEIPDIKLHLLSYIIISFVLSIIGLFFKKLKQNYRSRLFGIYNSIIILFLLIISCCITFLSFFSHIQPAWHNENIIFLNPIIYIILFIYSLKTLHKKHKSTRKLIKFEKISLIYSVYLIIYIIAKVLFSTVLIQSNYIIVIPIFIFFFVQSYIFYTKR